MRDPPSEVREWIEDGAPRRVREKRAAQGRIPKGRIPMPAYKDVLSKEEIDAVTAYVVAVAGQEGGPAAGTPEAKGRALAREKGCFGCHGPDGAGLVSNPGSFKGYIPGWRGPDYAELVRDDGQTEMRVHAGVAMTGKVLERGNHAALVQPARKRQHHRDDVLRHHWAADALHVGEHDFALAQRRH